MTKVTVTPGNCGFSVVITAEKDKGKKIRVSLESDCEMIMNMNKDISPLDMKSLFTHHIANPVYRSASQHLKHVACPVVSAILKAVEVEAGMAVPKDVSILFSKD